ncbi:MAG: trehalose-phosphatase [Microthrixaceae bacterium]
MSRLDEERRTLGEGLCAALEGAARARRLLVACDYDGTLAPIVDDPAAARPLPGTMELLAELAAMPDTWASLVSGRSLADLVHLSGPPVGLGLVGSHGAEHVEPRGDAGPSLDDAERAEANERFVAAEAEALLAELVAEVADEVARLPGASLETKPVGVAFHYRQADPDAGALAAEALLNRLAVRPGVHVKVGKMVAEFAVAGADKGQAMRRLMTQAGPDVTVFVGDDVTDEDALAVLRPGDVGIKVGAGPSRAAHRVAGPSQVVMVLGVLADERSNR